jgi:drug/metabolite transporter (DMT)-like permease
MTATPAPGQSLLWANLICVVSMVAWCAGLPATKLLVDVIPPVPLTFVRMMLAGLVLTAIWVAVEGTGPLRRVDWGQAILVGGVVMGVGGLGMAVALDLTDAVTVAIITASMPIMGLALEIAFDGRRITKALVVGVALGVLGGLVALDVRNATPALGWGALASTVSVFAYAWGSRATVKRFPGFTALGQTAVTVLGAGIAIGALALGQALWSGTGVDWAALGPEDAGALVLSSLVAVVVAQSLWIVSVARIGVGVASLHSNATPFYVMLITLMLGGAWNWMQAAGAALVILGVLVAQDMISRKAWNG